MHYALFRCPPPPPPPPDLHVHQLPGRRGDRGAGHLRHHAVHPRARGYAGGALLRPLRPLRLPHPLRRAAVPAGALLRAPSAAARSRLLMRMLHMLTALFFPLPHAIARRRLPHPPPLQVGQAASMASLLLAAGEPGHRRILPHRWARVQLADGQGGCWLHPPLCRCSTPSCAVPHSAQHHGMLLSPCRCAAAA